MLLPRQYVHRIIDIAPARVNVQLLAALWGILDCTVEELLVLGHEN